MRLLESPECRGVEVLTFSSEPVVLGEKQQHEDKADATHSIEASISGSRLPACSIGHSIGGGATRESVIFLSVVWIRCLIKLLYPGSTINDGKSSDMFY